VSKMNQETTKIYCEKFRESCMKLAIDSGQPIGHRAKVANMLRKAERC